MTFVEMGFIAQWVGSILLIGAYLPQIFKLLKTKNPTGISVLFWLMIATGCTTILVNMRIQDVAFSIQLTQALNMIGAWLVLFLVIFYKKKSGEKIKLHPIIVSIAVFLAGFMMTFSTTHTPAEVGNAFQTIGMFSLLMAYLPQIYHLYKVKNSDGLSEWLFSVLSAGLLLVTFNMLATGTPAFIIATELVNVMLIVVMWALTLYYRAGHLLSKLLKQKY